MLIPFGLQAIFSSTSEFLDSINVISCTSSKASKLKRVYETKCGKIELSQIFR